MLSVKNDRCEILNHESKTVYLAKTGLDESLSRSLYARSRQ